MTTQIVLKPIVRDNKSCIGIYFPFDDKLIQSVKSVGAKWSSTLKCWYVENTRENFNCLYQILKGKAWIDLSELKTQGPKPQKENQHTAHVLPPPTTKAAEQLNAFEQWMQSKRYSSSTIKTYTEAIRKFFRYYSTKQVHEIIEQNLVAFNNAYILKNHYSASFQNQVINAVELFYQTNRKVRSESARNPSPQTQ